MSKKNSSTQTWKGSRGHVRYSQHRMSLTTGGRAPNPRLHGGTVEVGLPSSAAQSQ